MKRTKVIFIIFLLSILLMTACESEVPLYKVYKTDSGYENLSLEIVNEFYYTDIESYEDIVNVNNGESIKADTVLLKDLESLIDDFINIRFNLNYLSIDKGSFESFMETIKINPKFDYKNFIKDYIECKVDSIVRKAIILPGGYIKEYKENDKTSYIVVFKITIYTTARDDNFFSLYPFYNNGDTNVLIYLLCEKDCKKYNIIHWQEKFGDSLTRCFKIN